MQFAPDQNGDWAVEAYGGMHTVIGWAIVVVSIDPDDDDKDWYGAPNTEVRPVVLLPSGIAPIQIDGEQRKLIRMDTLRNG